jgi:hypothetical protein
MPIFKTVNPKFFSVWNPEMAYVLGYFTADGCMLVNKRGAHFIEFTSIDIELLLLVQKALGSNHAISVRNRFAFPQNVGYRLQIGCKEIFKDLLTLGLTPAKSNTLRLPLIPVECFNHFVRGYFDGDGHVSIIKRPNRPSSIIESGFTSGSEQFLHQLHTNLKKYANIQGGAAYYNTGFRLNFSVNDSFKLYEYIYRGSSGIYLKRKFKVFQKYFRKQLRTGSSVG